MSGDSPAIRRAVESGISFEAAGRARKPGLRPGLRADRAARRRPRMRGSRRPGPTRSSPRRRRRSASRSPNWPRRGGGIAGGRKATGAPRQIAELEGWATFGVQSAECRVQSTCPRRSAVHSAIGNPQSAIVRSSTPSARGWPPRRRSAQAGQQGNWSSAAALKAAKAGCARVKEAIAQLSGEAAHRVLCDLVEWLRPFLDRYARPRTGSRALDFTDLLAQGARHAPRQPRRARRISSASSASSSWTSSRTPTRSRPRSSSSSASAPASTPPIGKPSTWSPANSSSSATRSNPSTASAAPTSTCTAKCARPSRARAKRSSFPSTSAPCRGSPSK